MTTKTYNENKILDNRIKPLSLISVMVCFYIFLTIERPWESIRYLQGFPIERVFAIAMILVAILNEKFKIISSPTNKWVYGLLALHFIFAPFAFKAEYALDQGIEYAKMVVLYLLMLAVADDEESLKLLVKAFIYTMIIYLTHSLWEYHNGRFAYDMAISRMMGVDKTAGDANSLGASIIYSLPFTFALLRNEARFLFRITYYGYFALAVVCVVLTGSRSSAVALVFAMIMYIFLQHGKRKILALVFIGLAISLTWSVMPLQKQDRIRTLWDSKAGPEGAHESAVGRIVGWEISWEMFKQQPLTGVGAGGDNFIGYRLKNNIDGLIGGNGRSATESHVLYGELLSELGIFGALFFAGLVLSTWKCCVKTRKKLIDSGEANGFLRSLTDAILQCLLLLLFLGFAGHNFYRPLWLWLAAWAGVLVKLHNASLQAQTTYEQNKHSTAPVLGAYSQ